MLDNKAYTQFVNGRFFNEGLRMTVGIALPAFIFGYFNMLAVGIAVSTGALCVSITDSAGPVHHRLIGMLFCIGTVAITAIVTYFSLVSPLATGVLILVSGFVFSMLSVYNARVSSIGLSALLVMVLCMQSPLTGTLIFLHVCYIVCGGVWYLAFSLTLHSIKPYKLIQQLSGEFLNGVSDYLKTRASFYDDHPDYEATYRSLLQQQVHIQSQQAALSELLFKTRAITRNSTRAGRSLLKIYIDVSDLFESIMSTYQQYDVLHKRFDETGILEEYRKQLLFLADELHGIAIAVGSGRASDATEKSVENLKSVKEKFESLRKDFMNEKNLNDFIGLGRIYNNIKALTEKINGLQYYTRYDKSQRKATETGLDLQKFNESQNIDPSLFLNNLNFKSNIFRHSLRVALSLLLGFIISIVFHIGHNYWILLTIVVILKPAYSLTKSRNRDRLIGTFIGVFIGVSILFVVKNNMALMVIMVCLMAGCYMFIRTKYFISVLLMTPYLVIFFHLLYPTSLTLLLYDRLLDTSIGSAIAFLSSLFLVPAWEHTTIKNYMVQAIEKNIIYYQKLSVNFSRQGTEKKEVLKTARQHALTALANVSDAFNRMLSEPKRFQKNNEQVYRFVVLNHILTSHFSALSFFLADEKRFFKSDIFLPVIENTISQLQHAADVLQHKQVNIIMDNLNVTAHLKAQTDELLQKRKSEINAGDLETETKLKFIETKSVTDQFAYIYNISTDIFKNVSNFTEEKIIEREQ